MPIEKAILGSIMREPHLLGDSSLKPDYFLDHQNKATLEAMIELNNKGLSFDVISMVSTRDPMTLGGVGRLQELQRYGNPEKFDQHVMLLMDGWREREKRHIMTVALEEDWDIPKVNIELDKLLEGRVESYSAIEGLLVKRYEAPWTKVTKKPGVNTGLKAMQDMTGGGWKANQLIIIAGRPSMGKTDVMLHIAREAGFDNYVPVAFSLEMTEDELMDRMIANIGHINRYKMQDAEKYLSDEQKDSWAKTLELVAATRLRISDKPSQTVSEIRLKTRKVMQEFKDKNPVVIIDYLTLMKSEQDYRGNKNQQVGEITEALKVMAKEFKCPVIVLSQLSRDVEKRPNKRPMLSDLRDSGSIEQDADTVIFLYRDSYYTKSKDDNSMELIIAKQRGGMTGTVLVNYNRKTGVITD